MCVCIGIYIHINTLVAMLSRPYPEVVIRCHQPPAQHLREPRTTFHYRWWASCFSTSRMYRGDCGFLGPQRRHSYKINLDQRGQTHLSLFGSQHRLIFGKYCCHVLSTPMCYDRSTSSGFKLSQLLFHQPSAIWRVPPVKNG